MRELTCEEVSEVAGGNFFGWIIGVLAGEYIVGTIEGGNAYTCAVDNFFSTGYDYYTAAQDAEIAMYEAVYGASDGGGGR